MNTIDNVVTDSLKKAGRIAETTAIMPVTSSVEKAASEETAKTAEITRQAADPTAVSAAVEKLNQLGNSVSPALKFELNRDTDVVVIKVLNRNTGELIRELPPEAVVEAATRGDDVLPSLVEVNV